MRFKILRRSFLSLCGALFVLSATADALTFPYPVGPLRRVSPTPNQAPDPILANLPAAMNDVYQQPFYPGLTPFPDNYLGGIIGQFNSYGLASMLVNPLNGNIMTALYGQNAYRDLTDTFGVTAAYSSILGQSTDGGKSWKFVPPPYLPISLGGTVSQFISTRLSYSKCGRLYALGNFTDSHPNPPNTVPFMGFVINHSDDNGSTWSAPTKILQTDQDFLFFPNFSGLGFQVGTILLDPVHQNLIHFQIPSSVWPSTFYGNIFYSRSEDEGNTWSKLKQIYSMVDDPVWMQEHFDPDFVSDPDYFIFGGQSITSVKSIISPIKDVLILPIQRAYPKIGSTVYTQSPDDTWYDIGVIRSFDNGQTWDPVAGVGRQYVFPIPHDPAFPTGHLLLPVPDGSETTPPIYSRFTGRLYLVYMINNPAVNPDPNINQFYTYIALSASSDLGKTWSDPVKINATPTKNLDPGNTQAFNPAVIMTGDGSLVVGYYDFRNYTGKSDPNSFLQTDVWMAIYKELPDPHGGSTGLGLDFDKEIRLSPTSYNGRIGLNSALRSASLNGISFSLNRNNQLIATFTMANESSPARSLKVIEA